MTHQVVQGRRIAQDEIDTITRLRREHPQWSRTRLSQQLAEQWNWRNGAGQLKDMAARTLLRKLHQRGLIDLPSARNGNNNSQRRAQSPPSWDWELPLACPPISEALGELLPLRVELVGSLSQRAEVRGLLVRHHYLGFGGAVGENLQYLVYDRGARLLAVSVFGAAAWKCAPRDQFIGWSPLQRRQGLPLLANQQRFLILPWVRVRHLGSHLLALLEKRLCLDWQGRYGHPIVLLETFVDQQRFAGTVYKAANWVRVGQTSGRSRNDRLRELAVPVKAVWLRSLCPDFRQQLETSCDL